MNAEQWLPCRYIALCSGTPPADRVRKEEGVTRYTKRRIADAPFIATESAPVGWVAATYGPGATSVWTSPARTCHHADAAASRPPKGTASINLKLALLRGSAPDAWAATTIVNRVSPGAQFGMPAALRSRFAAA
jgi:hypothetical protein